MAKQSKAAASASAEQPETAAASEDGQQQKVTSSAHHRARKVIDIADTAELGRPSERKMRRASTQATLELSNRIAFRSADEAVPRTVAAYIECITHLSRNGQGRAIPKINRFFDMLVDQTIAYIKEVDRTATESVKRVQDEYGISAEPPEYKDVGRVKLRTSGPLMGRVIQLLRILDDALINVTQARNLGAITSNQCHDIERQVITEMRNLRQAAIYVSRQIARKAPENEEISFDTLGDDLETHLDAMKQGGETADMFHPAAEGDSTNTGPQEASKKAQTQTDEASGLVEKALGASES